ncbi:hypothetical protein jhhlp_003636 [Lomentospora prolificans]|uniref:Bystin n=1 Tax=Lomentospora prolificans TaxID=41688 RepID=A0A2N3N9A4_9PEZI|nr:hypothetical protein jhhlp_003636 [Lomentospora prolificans]
MPKATTPTSARARRHNPLEDDLLATGPLRSKAPKRRAKDDKDEDGDHFVDSKASRNILKISQALSREAEDQLPKAQVAQQPRDQFAFDERIDASTTADNEFYYDDEVWGDDDEEIEEIEVDPNDLETFRKFMPEEDDDLLKHGWDRRPPTGAEEDSEEPTNLADLILEKIYAHEAAEARADAGVEDDFEIPPKVVDVYTKVGLILSRHRSGPIPKPMKILPTVPHWEEILQITKPEEWSANACDAVTRVFVASKAIVVQRYLEMVLLERVKEDIYEHKKLNPHLFKALERALFKPSAFFKGFLFPLVGGGTCTLREATIIAGVLRRHHVPVLHSAAAIKGLCDIAAQEASQGTEGGGATNILIHTLLRKGYALPYQVIDALVFHFLRFRSVDPASVQESDLASLVGEEAPARRKLPVIWHQCFLEFAQKYRNDITEDQREALLDLLLTHGHSAIGPEIRKELLAGRGRGVPIPQEAAPFDGDDTMAID